MLAIKLQRIGKKHQPSYRVVAAEKRSKLGGPPREDLGSYNSFTKAISFNKERVLYWLKIGAKPTATVYNLLIKEEIISGPKHAVKTRKSNKEKESSDVKTPAPLQENQAEPTVQPSD